MTERFCGYVSNSRWDTVSCLVATSVLIPTHVTQTPPSWDGRPGQFPEGAWIYSLRHRVQTGSASYPMHNADCFSEGKAAGTWS